MINNNLLPNIYGIFEVKYFSRNKIRMEISKLKDNSELISDLKNNLNKIKAIKNYKVISSLGSLTVEFDNSQIDSNLMLGIILKLTDLEKEIFAKRNGRIKMNFHNLLNFSDITIYNKTKGLFDTKSLVALILAIYGIKKLKTTPSLPSGATLVWWAYNLFNK
ncbi:HMA2 domain-containing protein [Fusobacterium gastrosuis]|uniref:HMA2 domain-containing protein n=1 Tax=Fusobacterium gastrosuis TaxID=1755100 RepID=UPI0025EF75F6|nr:hypothetical protein [uncultured Fusobacterium sp.]MDD7409820.1 hypothetical protein [Fusobacteriaceae bacterium]MDY5712942.1 hypothetical protein [Fusobacterium gastrosuis]